MKTTETTKLIEKAGSIQDELYKAAFILDGMDAVLTMMMQVETDQKAVANMLLSCVSTMKSSVSKANRVSSEIRSSLKETDTLE